MSNSWALIVSANGTGPIHQSSRDSILLATLALNTAQVRPAIIQMSLTDPKRLGLQPQDITAAREQHDLRFILDPSRLTDFGSKVDAKVEVLEAPLATKKKLKSKKKKQKANDDMEE